MNATTAGRKTASILHGQKKDNKIIKMQLLFAQEKNLEKHIKQ